MFNFCGTTICVFTMAKLSSELTFELRRAWGGSSMKVPCRIRESSQQGFDFVIKVVKILTPKKRLQIDWLTYCKNRNTKMIFFSWVSSYGPILYAAR